MKLAVDRTLDFTGLSCPLPVVKTAKAMKELPSGAVVEVIATDPGSVPDFRAWCTATKNELVEHTAEGGIYRYFIRKR